MTKQLTDAVKLIEMLIAECDTGPNDHAWAKCRHCSAIALVQDHDPRAHALLRAVMAELKTR